MTLKQAQEKAREKLTRKYDIRYFDGSTYAVGEEFEKDLDQIIKQLYEDVVREASEREKQLKTTHKVELDAIACMSIEDFVRWRGQR